ncbi:hypothetical protein B0H13DRAFT_1910284 [Mycena leptocephala]|nr:hypothetical protein B0H13DRAFT_1910284 [Mycena leptocephala]
MVKETYKFDHSLPTAMSTLRHVIKRISMTKSPHVMDAFVLAIRSFTQKEYAAQGDSTRSGFLLGWHLRQYQMRLRTSYLIALDKAVQEYASSRTEGMDEAFSQEVLTVFKEIEDGVYPWHRRG